MNDAPHPALSRNAVLLLASMAVAAVPTGYLQVVLPLYLNRAGMDPSLIGVLYTVSGLVTALLVAVSGLLADRFGRLRFVLWGTALPIVSYAIFAGTLSPVWLTAASVLGGVGLANGAAGALTVASFDALLAENTPERHRTRVFTWGQALWSTALAIGAAFAGLPEWLRSTLPALGDLGAYQPPFLGLIALAGIATAMLVPVRDDRVATVTASGERRSWLPRRSVRPILWYAASIGFLGFGLGVATQLMPLWFKLRFGAEEATLGPWYAVAQVLSLSSLVLAPWLERRFGGGRGVFLAQVLGGGCLALIALAPSFEVGALLFIVRQILANVCWPLQQALLMGAVAPEERASAAGIGFAVWGATNAIGPSVGGWLLGAGILTVPIVLGGLAYALAGLGFGLGFGARSTGRQAPRAMAG